MSSNKNSNNVMFSNIKGTEIENITILLFRFVIIEKKLGTLKFMFLEQKY